MTATICSQAAETFSRIFSSFKLFEHFAGFFFPHASYFCLSSCICLRSPCLIKFLMCSVYLRLNGEFTGWMVETTRWTYLKISLFLSEYLEVSGDAEASGHLVLLTASVV